MDMPSKINTMPLPTTGQMGLSTEDWWSHRDKWSAAEDSFLGASSLPPSPEAGQTSEHEVVEGTPDHNEPRRTGDEHLYDTLISSLPFCTLQRELDDFSSPATEVVQHAASHDDQPENRTAAASILAENLHPILDQLRTLQQQCEQLTREPLLCVDKVQAAVAQAEANIATAIVMLDPAQASLTTLSVANRRTSGPPARLTYMVAPTRATFDGALNDENVGDFIASNSPARRKYDELQKTQPRVLMTDVVPGELWSDQTNGQVWLFPIASPSEFLKHIGKYGKDQSSQHFGSMLKWIKGSSAPRRKSSRGLRGHNRDVYPCDHFEPFTSRSIDSASTLCVVTTSRQPNRHGDDDAEFARATKIPKLSQEDADFVSTILL